MDIQVHSTLSMTSVADEENIWKINTSGILVTTTESRLTREDVWRYKMTAKTFDGDIIENDVLIYFIERCHDTHIYNGDKLLRLGSRQKPM